MLWEGETVKVLIISPELTGKSEHKVERFIFEV